VTWLLISCRSPGSSVISKQSSCAVAISMSIASFCAAVSLGTSGAICAASMKVSE
jgi:hypothetical protein